MSEPPTKRLRQSSILDCFKPRREHSAHSSTSVTSEEHKSDLTVADTLDKDTNSDKERNIPSPQPSTSTLPNDMYNTQSSATRSGSSYHSQDNNGSMSETEHAPVQSETSSSTSKSLGTPISELRRAPACCMKLPPLKANPQLTVMYKLPHTYTATQPPTPHPSSYNHQNDKWDAHHVRMPCSNHNEYPVNCKAVRRWNIIEKALLQDIKNTVQLQDAILSYNTRYSKRWDFSALHRLFLEVYPAEKTRQFFDKTLKDMVRLALQLPHLCTQPMPMLESGHNHSLTLSQQQAASLLANAFFCTFPRRNAHHRNSEYANYPNINFNGLFAGGHMPRKVEKLKTIIHYFTRVTSQLPMGTLTYRRQCIAQMPDWENSSKCLSRLHVGTSGTIESDGTGMLQVDFANKYLGGGVLGHGCVQEEIRFLICPEMILSKLFTEVLDKHECLVMTGCERFSDYIGYADTYRWGGDHVDSTPRDDWGRLRTEVVAIDALVVHDYSSQFKMWAVKRELNKAYCGFASPLTPTENLAAVCTGNWGCGAFGGDTTLKALIQMIAATEAGRDICYFTFNDESLCQQLYDMHQLVSTLHISDIMVMIQQYYRNVCLKSRGQPLIHLYDYMASCLLGEDDTDVDSVGSDDITYPSTVQSSDTSHKS